MNKPIDFNAFACQVAGIKPQFKHPAMHQMKAKKQHYEAFNYTMSGVELDCELEFDGGCRGSFQDGLQMEPDEPDQAYLHSACVGDTDIIELLSDLQREEIEAAFLAQDRDSGECDAPDDYYDYGR